MATRLTARDLLERLVGFPTISRDSNLALIDFVETYLDGFGVKSHRVYNEDRTKASLYAHIGPEIDGGVVLSGHTDVVPTDGQAWDTDPFKVTQIDGRLYGRGTCDMKGFDALALWAVPLALEQGVKRPIQIAFSYDEEVGCLGAPPMIDDMLASDLPRASTVIVGEPSMMKTVTGHKGGIGFKTHIKGFEVHSSLMDRGVSAIMEAAKIIDWANEKNAKNQAATPGPLAATFDPPFTTLHVGTIQGGTAHNITAKDCYFGMDFRCVPGESLEDWKAAYFSKLAEIETGMKAIHPDAEIVADQHFNVPALRPEENGMAEELVRNLTGDNSANVVSYGTEAGQFQERGYSAVICGPGDIAHAHQPNEFISVAQFEAGQRFMKKMVDYLAQ